MKISKKLATRVIIKCVREIPTLSSRYLVTGSTPVISCFDCAPVTRETFALFGYGENRSVD